MHKDKSMDTMYTCMLTRMKHRWWQKTTIPRTAGVMLVLTWDDANTDAGAVIGVGTYNLIHDRKVDHECGHDGDPEPCSQPEP